MRKHTDDLLLPSDYERIFGVSRRTAKRWNNYGTRPELIALARLVTLGDLGALDQLWNGWILRHGRIYDPLGSEFRGWTPGHVRALQYLYAHRSALERELRQLKTLSQPAQDAPERKPRQIPNLARPAQSMSPDRRSGRERRFQRRGPAPVSGQIGPGLVRANPARHKRSL